jgi:hypothetical protein
MPCKPVLTLGEASRAYRLSVKVLRKLYHRKELHGYRGGIGKGKIFLYEQSLEEYRDRKSNVRQPEPAQQKSRRTADGGFQVFHLP